MTARPKRRWYQFSLRTLLIGVALLAAACGYVGWNARIVRERNAMRERLWNLDKGVITEFADSPTSRIAQISWIRALLGDKPIKYIVLPSETDRDRRRQIKATFPEVTLLYTTGVTFNGAPALVDFPDGN